MTSSVQTPTEPVETSSSIFDLLGGERGVRALVDRFYDLMDMESDLKELRAAHGPTWTRLATSCSGSCAATSAAPITI